MSAQESSISIKDAIEFIRNHPTSRLKQHSDESLAKRIHESILEGSFVYDTHEGRLSAICVGKLYPYGRYHIVALQATTKESFEKLLITYLVRFAVKYPILTAKRKNSLKRYYPLRFLLWTTHSKTTKTMLL